MLLLCERVVLTRSHRQRGRWCVVVAVALCLLPPLLLTLSRQFIHSPAFQPNRCLSAGGTLSCLTVYVNKVRRLNDAQQRSSLNHTPPILQRLARYYSQDDKQYWYDDTYDLGQTKKTSESALDFTASMNDVKSRKGKRSDYRANGALLRDVTTDNSTVASVRLVVKQLPHSSVIDDGKPTYSFVDNNSTSSQRRQQGQQVLSHQSPGTCPLQAVSKGIFWSSQVEKIIPTGISAHDIIRFRQLTSLRPMKLEAGTWRTCGRPRNALIHLSDGSKACARHRHPDTRFILGDVLSFYLARLLAMDNIAPISVLQVNNSDGRWKADELRQVNWSTGDYVSISKWIDDLEPADVTMPSLLQASYNSGIPLSSQNMSCPQNSVNTDNSSLPLTSGELVDLFQWSDMIIFDYLTGNYDRVASMQDGAELGFQPSVRRHNIRNLYRQSTGKLWLVDNESGLMDAYDLLYRSSSARRFTRYHMQMLRSICIFSETSVTRLRRLSNHVRPVQVLIDFAQISEPFLARFHTFINKQLFIVHFDKRLNELLSWIRQCQLNFSQT